MSNPITTTTNATVATQTESTKGAPFPPILLSTGTIVTHERAANGSSVEIGFPSIVTLCAS